MYSVEHVRNDLMDFSDSQKNTTDSVSTAIRKRADVLLLTLSSTTFPHCSIDYEAKKRDSSSSCITNAALGTKSSLRFIVSVPFFAALHVLSAAYSISQGTLTGSR